MSDNVNHPDYYTFGEIECIDAIHAALGNDGFMSYCEGNVIKYLWRHRLKGGVESLDKARWYLDRMIETWKEMPVECVIPISMMQDLFKCAGVNTYDDLVSDSEIEKDRIP